MDGMAYLMEKCVHTHMVKKHPSTKNSHDGWQDKTSVTEFKRRLAIIMKGMAQLAPKGTYWFNEFMAEKDVDRVIKDKFHVKRILRNDGQQYCHNKIVVVDDTLMYVGSDNAYPCYNEEHGVWVDDKKTIQDWKTSYWQGLWDWSTDATD